MFEFFRLWLLVLGAALAVAGTVLSIGPDSKVLGLMNRLIAMRFWPSGEPAAGSEVRRWLVGVVGATMAGWGLTVAVIAAQIFQSRSAGAWWAIAAGSMLWFALDTGRSYAARVGANVVLNVVVLVLIAIPLAGTIGEVH